MGLLGQATPPTAIHSATGTPWDWIAELAAATSGVVWDSAGQSVPVALLGGDAFNLEAGRGPLHQREGSIQLDTPFHAGLTQGVLLGRLRTLNRHLGWDHDTRVEVPLDRLPDPAVRAALWCALYAGAHAVLSPGAPWDGQPFASLWKPVAPNPLPLDIG